MLSELKKHSQNAQAIILAQSMLIAAGMTIRVDGSFGDGTEKIVKLFQLQNNLVVDGVIGEKTWLVLFDKAQAYLNQVVINRFLSEQDLINAANRLGIEVAAIKAVNEVESRGRGFLNDFPVILFERHVFWKRLEVQGLSPQLLSKNNEDILSTKPGGYKGGMAEVERLNRAKIIHAEAALESASWGAFQVMGYHWKNLGYSSIHEFVSRMMQNESEHLAACSRFLQLNRLDKTLRLNGKSSLDLDDFRVFARGYNGPSYEENNYHTKMYKAYLKYQKEISVQQQMPIAA